MASLRDLKKRIQTVKSTRQITKAMKMVSASKLKKNQDALLSLRPYAYKLIEIMNSLKDSVEDFEHPLFSRRDIKKTRLVIISSERGLCGSYNSNIIKKAVSYMKEADLDNTNCVIDFVGKKAYEYFKRRHCNIGDIYKLNEVPVYHNVSLVVERLIDNYINGEFDALVIIYNEFKSAMCQQITVERLFPIVTPEFCGSVPTDKYKYEPDKRTVLAELLPKYVKIEILRVLLESLASEHGARMSAMESATKNSEEMMKKLSLIYNRSRQAVITTELMEIVGGKEALENG